MRPVVVLLLTVSLAGVAAAQVTMQGRGAIRGVAHDSLLQGPLAGAEVWVRGTTLRTLTDSTGQFRFDTVPEGRQLLVLSHPGLDSVGFFNLVGTAIVETGRVATAIVATPSLRTIWARRCPEPLAAGADSGVMMGDVTDAATGNRLAGAGVVGTWIVLTQAATEVASEERKLATLTDSLGSYVACGVSTDATIHTRAYGAGDSSGAIQVRPGTRAVARRDFSVGRQVRGATLRATIVGADARPIAGARVTMNTTTATTRGDGLAQLTRLPPGSQWLSVRAVGRAPLDQAVELRDGDTLHIQLSVGEQAVTLDTVRVVGSRAWSLLQGIEERKKRGFGVVRTAEELRGRTDLIATLQGMPSLLVARRRGSIFLVFPGRSLGSLGGCNAAVFLDGMRVGASELESYSPDDLLGIEVYPRGTGAPMQFATTSGCGVVLVWTKFMR